LTKDLATKPVNTLTSATIIIALFSLLSKLTGLVRLNILTSRFDAGDVLDIFYAAFRLPDFVYNLLILGTLSAAFIPVFCDYLTRDKTEALKLANTILNIALIVMGFFAAVLFVLAPIFVSLIVPGFTPEKQIEVVKLTRIMSLAPLFFSLSSVLSSVLNSLKKFAVVAMMPVVYNLSIIFGAVILYPAFGKTGLAWGVVLGAALHFVLQLPAAYKTGFTWRPYLKLDLPGVRQTLKLYIPRIFGMDSAQISLLVSTIVGSSLLAGSITYYNLAFDLQSLPLSIVAVSFAIVAFPLLSEAYAKSDRKTFAEIFNINLSQILYLMIPLSLLMLILRAQLVRLVFGRGEFGWEATVVTITTFGFFTVSLFAQGLIPLFTRAFYAMQNTLAPVLIGLSSMLVNIVGAVILTQYYHYGVEGLAIAFSVSVVLNLMLLFVVLEFKFGNLVDFDLVYKIFKITAASVLMGGCSYGMLYLLDRFLDTHTVVGLFLQTLGSASVGAVVYLLLGIALNLAESRHILLSGRNWLKKLSSSFTRYPQV